MMQPAELWWNAIPGPVRLTGRLASQLLHLESTVLCSTGNFPWPDDFRLNVKDRIQRVSPHLLVEYCDASAMGDMTPGRWILDRIGGGRTFCLPSDDPLRVAIQHGYMKNRIFWVANCRSREQANAWIALANQLKRRAQEGCVCLLAPPGMRGNSGLSQLAADGYFGAYDLSFFAASLVSSMDLTSFEKKYLTELAVSLAAGSAQTCADLAAQGRALLETIGQAPEHTHAVWLAQMRTVFAPIEEKKFALVRENEEAVRSLFGTVDDYGNRIDSVDDIELRHLIYAARRFHLPIPPAVMDILQILYQDRNHLAHHHILPYDELKELDALLSES